MVQTDRYWESTSKEIPRETQTIINEYLLSLKLANKAEATTSKYCWVLERFFSECQVPLEQLRTVDISDWLYEFSIGKKPRTLDLFLSALSSFFHFCLEEDYIETTLIKKWWRPKIPQPLPKYLSEQEFARVKLVAERLSTWDRALVLFLFSSGCRRSEVANLNIQDVLLEKRTAEVKGKGKKIRHVHFSVECSQVLREYLRTRSADSSEPLFLNRRGRRLQSGAIYEIIRKLGKKAELAKSLHPHSCRHTFATNMLARGADLEFIADEMGHADLETTQIYARLPKREIIAQYRKFMG